MGGREEKTGGREDSKISRQARNQRGGVGKTAFKWGKPLNNPKDVPQSCERAEPIGEKKDPERRRRRDEEGQ